MNFVQVAVCNVNSTVQLLYAAVV